MNPFADKEVWTKLKDNPKTRQYLEDPGFKKIMEALHNNPKDLGSVMGSVKHLYISMESC